jgi:Mg-chelatase subunit ChlD
MAEANPNANLPLPKPEAVLSPNPPPPLNSREGIVFLLDVSGSMYEPHAGSTRLMLARQELSRQIRSLKNGTPFAITIYAQTGRNSGPLVAASDVTREAAVRFIMEDFDCGGGTNLPAGFASAQELHAGHIILVSDGDLNMNQTDLSAQAQRILGTPGHGPALNIVAICPRSSTDAERLLQGLADQQNGNYNVEQAGEKTALLTTGKNEATAP